MAGLGLAAQVGLPIAGSLFQSWQARRANQANRRDQQEALGVLGTEGGALQDQYAGLVQQQLGTNQDVLYGGDVPKGMQPNPTQLQGYRGLYDASMAEARGYNADLTGQYADRLTTGMSMLQGLGESARSDIDRQYRGVQSRTEANLRDRGFSGSLLASNALGVQNQKDRATGAMNEQLRQQQLGLYSNLSGDYLNATGQGQANLLNLGTNLAGQFIGAQQGTRQDANQMSMNQLAYADQNLNRRLGLITGYPAQGPPPGNPFDAASAGFNNYMSHQTALEAQSAGKNDWLGPFAATVGTAAFLG